MSHPNLPCFPGQPYQRTLSDEVLVFTTIRDSSFSGNLNGMAIGAISDMKIAGNRISGCNDMSHLACSGLTVGLHGPVSNLKVENNYIHGMRNGINLHGVNYSKFSGNHVWGMVERGIEVQDGSIGNIFDFNILFDNGREDLFHDLSSMPNKWVENSCESKSGDDIPEC